MTDAIVGVSCVWSRADEVDTAVLTLAAEHCLGFTNRTKAS